MESYEDMLNKAQEELPEQAVGGSCGRVESMRDDPWPGSGHCQRLRPRSAVNHRARRGRVRPPDRSLSIALSIQPLDLQEILSKKSV